MSICLISSLYVFLVSGWWLTLVALPSHFQRHSLRLVNYAAIIGVNQKLKFANEKYRKHFRLFYFESRINSNYSSSSNHPPIYPSIRSFVRLTAKYAQLSPYQPMIAVVGKGLYSTYSKTRVLLVLSRIYKNMFYRMGKTYYKHLC